MLLNYLERAASAAPSTSGLRYHGKTATYRELSDRAYALAAGFGARGLGSGKAVGVLSPNCPEVFVLLFAIAGSGAAAVFIHPAAPAGEVEGICRRLGVSLLIADARSQERVSRVVVALGAELPIAVHLFVPGEAASLNAIAGNPSASAPEAGPHKTAVYMFSSGSTGRPKLVPHTHATLIGNVENCVRVWGIAGDDVAMNSLPPSHSMGLTQMMREVVAGGATTLIWDDPRPLLLTRNKMIETIAEEKVTILPGVPMAYDILAGATTSAGLGSLRICYAGGVTLTRDVYDKFASRFKIPLRQAYGSTETSMIAINLDQDVEPSWESVGRPIDGVEVDLVPTPLCPGDDRGELYVRTPGLSPGYLEADAQSMARFRDGGFELGDLARLDGDGNIFIIGRTKLIYEVVGEKVDPIEVEDVLVSHPSVVDAVVVAVPDALGENRLKAVVVGDGGDGMADALLRHCRSRLRAYKVPAVIEFRDEIPRSATGKVLRGKLVD